MVDAPDLGSGFARSEGSSPFIRIKSKTMKQNLINRIAIAYSAAFVILAAILATRLGVDVPIDSIFYSLAISVPIGLIMGIILAKTERAKAVFAYVFGGSIVAGAMGGTICLGLIYLPYFNVFTREDGPEFSGVIILFYFIAAWFVGAVMGSLAGAIAGQQIYRNRRK